MLAGSVAETATSPPKNSRVRLGSGVHVTPPSSEEKPRDWRSGDEYKWYSAPTHTSDSGWPPL